MSRPSPVPRPPDATYPCPGGCGRVVPLREFACWGCWHRLPLALRHELSATAGRRSVAGVRVRFEAREWFRVNPPWPEVCSPEPEVGP